MGYQKIPILRKYSKKNFSLIEGRRIETRDSGRDGNLGGGRWRPWLSYIFHLPLESGWGPKRTTTFLFVQNRKVVVLLGPLFGIAYVVYLSLAPRIGMRRRGGPKNKQKSGLPFGTSFWDIQYCISLACPKNRDKDSRNTQQGAKGNFDRCPYFLS